LTDPPPSSISTLSLHDALPISRRRFACYVHVVNGEFQRAVYLRRRHPRACGRDFQFKTERKHSDGTRRDGFARAVVIERVVCTRSEEHTSELQSLAYLVCRLLL